MIDAALLAHQYEALRQEAIEEGHGQGLALFLSRGMMARMDALSAFTPIPRRATLELPHLPRLLSSELAMLLADMVLACQEVTR